MDQSHTDSDSFEKHHGHEGNPPDKIPLEHAKIEQDNPSDKSVSKLQNSGKEEGNSATALSSSAPNTKVDREPNSMEDNHNEAADSHEQHKNAWHAHHCDLHPEDCQDTKSSSSQKEEGKGFNKISEEKVSHQDDECKNFYNLPERLKRKLPKSKISMYKRNCMPKPSKSRPDSNDGTNSQQSSKSSGKDAAESMKLLDTILTDANKTPLSPAAAAKATSSGFHPGYTTIELAKPDVSDEKKVDEMPDTSETFMSRAVRPDFSTMPGETPGKSTDMAYYFRHKSDPSEKSMLLRAIPSSKQERVYTDSSSNVYGRFDSFLHDMLLSSQVDNTSTIQRQSGDLQTQPKLGYF